MFWYVHVLQWNSNVSNPILYVSVSARWKVSKFFVTTYSNKPNAIFFQMSYSNLYNHCDLEPDLWPTYEKINIVHNSKGGRVLIFCISFHGDKVFLCYLRLEERLIGLIMCGHLHMCPSVKYSHFNVKATPGNMYSLNTLIVGMKMLWSCHLDRDLWLKFEKR